MKIYKCAVCSFKTANKTFYEAHLRRSKHAPPTTEPKLEIVPEILPELTPEIIEKKPKRRIYAEIIQEKSTESEELEHE